MINWSLSSDVKEMVPDERWNFISFCFVNSYILNIKNSVNWAEILNGFKKYDSF